MNKIALKKTLSLHKYNVRVTEILSNWKFILPIIASICGLIFGSLFSKGEGETYQRIGGYIESYVLNSTYTNIYSSFIVYLLIPTLFAIVLFFCGLSVYGGVISNLIPAAYSFFIGVITYYLYSNFTLKGLAYSVIIIFPYAVLSVFSLILITSESISMSQQLTKSLNRNFRNIEYKFAFYYKNCLKSYVFIILAAVVKTVLDSLFIGLFSF